MEFILYWIMVSSDYMIRIEVALMDRLNQKYRFMVRVSLVHVVVLHAGCGSAARCSHLLYYKMTFH